MESYIDPLECAQDIKKSYWRVERYRKRFLFKWFSPNDDLESGFCKNLYDSMKRRKWKQQLTFIWQYVCKGIRLLSCRMVELILARTDWVQMTRTTSDEPAPNICSAIRTGRFIFFLSVDMYMFSNAKKSGKREKLDIMKKSLDLYS
jgi:hypothetical protein